MKHLFRILVLLGAAGLIMASGPRLMLDGELPPPVCAPVNCPR